MARRKKKRGKQKAKVNALSRQAVRRIEVSARGPWDAESWAPTPEMEARAKAARPFWSYWPAERIDSIDELARAFRLRCAGSLISAFDPQRVPHHPGPYLSEEDADLYARLKDWLIEMRHRPLLRSRVSMVQCVILRDETCHFPALFAQAIDLHVIVRKRSQPHNPLTAETVRVNA